MIVKIEPARPSCRAALDYNEGKVIMGVADLIGYSNIESTDRDYIYGIFERYERTRYHMRQVSFHASVNPSVTDSCTEEQVLEFISGLMEHLGYGGQPYLVYRHFDIDREHYHIVSVRADRNGRKIRNYYDFHRAREYMESVSQQYGFTMAGGGCRKERVDTPLSVKFVRYDPRKDVGGQLSSLFSRALEYDYETLPQLVCVLRDLGVEATIVQAGEHPTFSLRGLDREGRPVSNALSEEDLGRSLYSEALSRLSGNRRLHSRRSREKERVRSLVGFAFDFSKSEGHFVNILRNKGISVHMSRREDGALFGVTFVDQRTRTVFKASELKDVISVRRMAEAVSTGHWRVEDRGGRKSAYVKYTRAAAKEDAILFRNLHAGVVAKAIRPVGQPKGNSWSGRPSQTPQQRAAKRDEGSTGGVNASFEDNRFTEKIF